MTCENDYFSAQQDGNIVAISMESGLAERGRADPGIDDAVWPGFNCAVMMAVEKELETLIFEALQSLHKRMGGKALKVFGWPLERVI